jgi:hypothetical protein
MPKPLHHIDPILMHSLKMKLQDNMGVIVRNFTDCKRLASAIFENQKIRISASTLYRLYFSEDSSNHFYLSTLDLLVSIVHPDKSWNQFSEEFLMTQSKLSFIGLSPQKLHSQSLLESCLEANAWKPICQWFEKLSTDDESMNSSLLLDNIGFHLRNVLESNPHWEKKFYEKTSHYPFIKTSFFEMGTDPEFALHNSYLSFQYYRKALNVNSPLYENDSLYIDTLQCLYLFKKKDKDALTQYAAIRKKYAHIRSLKNGIHIFNLSRLWILELHDYKFRTENWSKFNWDPFCQKVDALYPSLELFDRRILRYMVLDACIFLQVPKQMVEVFLKILDVQEITRYNLTKIRYYLEQINPNGSRWRKQFPHF